MTQETPANGEEKDGRWKREVLILSVQLAAKEQELAQVKKERDEALGDLTDVNRVQHGLDELGAFVTQLEIINDLRQQLTAAEERANELEDRLGHWQDEAIRVETLRQQAEGKAAQMQTKLQEHIDGRLEQGRRDSVAILDLRQQLIAAEDRLAT